VTAILVTRPAGQADPLVAELERRGYTVHAVPAIATRALDVAWPDLAAYDWIAVTSAAGVETLPGLTTFSGRWAVVGKATAAALRARGVEASVVPDEARGADLAGAIPEPRGSRVLLVRGSLAADDLPSILRARGADVDEVVSYETIEGPESSRAPLARAAFAAAVFASGSAVRGFVKLGGSTDVPAITIGPRTTAVAREAGFTVIAEAAGRSAGELAAAVERVIPVEVGPDA
jgi:uroporphyrinogen-III synthase